MEGVGGWTEAIYMLWCWMDMDIQVDSPHGERIVASTLPIHYKRVAMHLRLVSGNRAWE